MPLARIAVIISAIVVRSAVPIDRTGSESVRLGSRMVVGDGGADPTPIHHRASAAVLQRCPRRAAPAAGSGKQSFGEAIRVVRSVGEDRRLASTQAQASVPAADRLLVAVGLERARSRRGNEPKRGA